MKQETIYSNFNYFISYFIRFVLHQETNGKQQQQQRQHLKQTKQMKDCQFFRLSSSAFFLLKAFNYLRFNYSNGFCCLSVFLFSCFCFLFCLLSWRKREDTRDSSNNRKTSKVKQIELKHKNKMLISFKLYSSTKSFNKLRGGREAKIANKNKMV